jgi:uncharacterized HAD superfamily protein
MSGSPSLPFLSGQVAFDIDGVFGDVMGLFLRLARELYTINHLRYEDITEYYLYDCLPLDRELIDHLIEKVSDYPYALEMNPFDDSVEVLTRYAEKHPLVFITARKKLEPVRDWVMRSLSKVNPQAIEVISSQEHHLKLGILKDRGFSFYVDDHLDTCRLLSENDITPIVFDQPWNEGRHNHFRVANWRELSQVLLNGH